MVKKKGYKKDLEEIHVYAEEYEFLDEPGETVTPADEIEISMHIGDKDVDVYSEEGLDEEIKNDEIAPWEQGFMEGELHGGNLGECHLCGKILDQEEVYERELNGIKRFFCSKNCIEDAE